MKGIDPRDNAVMLLAYKPFAYNLFYGTRSLAHRAGKLVETAHLRRNAPIAPIMLGGA